MIELYSNNLAVEADSVIPFNNVYLKKGCTAVASGNSTINLNKCGVYMVSVNASAEASTTLQLIKNGIPQAQAQSTGLNPSFVTLVQVSEDNSYCACSSPTSLQVSNTIATTLTDVNVCVTKIC